MIILYSNTQNELMVEIGTINKSFAFYISEIIMSGLENVLKKKFTAKEIKDNMMEWSENLKQEMYFREIEYERYEKIYHEIHHINVVLNDLNHEKKIIDLNQLKKYQNKILNNQTIDIEKDLLNIDFENIKLFFDNKEIKHIKQKHRTSCTLACLATITNQEYDKVFKELKMKYKLNRFFSTNENQWKEYIGEYGYSLGEMKKVNSWKCVPDYALCVVQGSIYYQNVTRDIQHAIVVRRQNGLISILDPSLDKIKYDFWNYHLTLKECYEIIKKP